MRKLAIILVASLLSACATMNTKDCQGTNWRDKGYSDALKGRAIWLTGHTKACAKVGVVPNRSTYIAGHNAGSRVFCTFENGVRFGQTGDIPRGICTAPELQQPFYSGYDVGYGIYLELEDLRERMMERQLWLNHYYHRRHDHGDRDRHGGGHNHNSDRDRQGGDNNHNRDRDRQGGSNNHNRDNNGKN